jgi:hypothetical protein
MTKLYSVKGKPKIIDDINDIDDLIIHLTTIIIEVDIISINEKHWSRFKKDNSYVIDDIIYFDLIVYQDGKIDGSYKLINSLLKDSYAYQGLLKKFIKNASHGQILFHSKINTNESLVELDVNNLYA